MRKRSASTFAIISAALVGIVMVSGCNQTDAGPFPTIHTIQGPSERKPGLLTKEKVSLGGIHIGDSQDTVKKVFGEPDETGVAHSTPFPYWEYKKANVTIMFFKRGETDQPGGVVDILVTSPSPLATEKGIKIGSTLEQIATQYGDVYVNGSSVFITGQNTTSDPTGATYYYPQYQFALNGNKVASIELTNYEVKP